MLALTILKEMLAVCRLDSKSRIPSWISGELTSVTHTSEELSIVCAEAAVPSSAIAERGWRCFKVEGPLDFALTGILSALTAPLAEAGISIFALSTFNTDYLLVKETNLLAAKQVLAKFCHIQESL